MIKKIILVLFPVCLNACAQEEVRQPAPGPEKFESKYVKLIKDTAVMMLIENVVIHYGDLYMEADSALLDRPHHTITGYSVRKARFKGEEISKLPEKATIKYIKGKPRWEVISGSH